MTESWTPTIWRWTILCGAMAVAAVVFIDAALNGHDEPANIAVGDSSACKQAAMQEARENDAVAPISTMSAAEADVVVQYCSPGTSEPADSR